MAGYGGDGGVCRVCGWEGDWRMEVGGVFMCVGTFGWGCEVIERKWFVSLYEVIFLSSGCFGVCCV